MPAVNLILKALLRLFIASVLVLAALLSLAYSVPGQSSWWIELLHYVPYHAYLAPALLALLFSLWLGRIWRLAALFGLVLVTTVIMGLATGRADAGTGHVRMMTYNVKAYLAMNRPGGWAQLEDEIKRQAPDVLVMQDAGELTFAHAEQASVGARIFAGRQVYFSGQYIVASRFPLRECGRGDMASQHERYTFVHCVVSINGEGIDLVTAHLISPRSGLNATRFEKVGGIDDWQQNFADRLAQSRHLANAVAQLTAQHHRPLILAGDLNAAENSPVVRNLLNQGLRDAYSSSAWGYGYTLGHALRPGVSFLRIDHILVSPEIGVERAFAGGRLASEHRPVIADLWLHRSP